MWNFKSTGRVKTVDSQNPNVQGNVETYRSLTQAEYDELSYEEKHSGIVYFITDGATDHIAASSIRYDNSGTHIASTSVQGAIDTLDAMLGAIEDGDLSELESIISSAEVVLDDVQPLIPTSAGTVGQVLTKTATGANWEDQTGGGTVDSVNGVTPDSNKNVQIDVELTQAEYNALPTSKNSDNINYYITDGIASESSINLGANAIAYNNTDSDLVATNVQDAIDENASAIMELSAGLTLAGTYSTSESIVGKWIDGKPIYRRVFTGLNYGGTTASWTNTGVIIQNIDRLVKCEGWTSGTNIIATMGFRTNGSAIQYWCANSWTGSDTVIAEYTKTTD